MGWPPLVGEGTPIEAVEPIVLDRIMGACEEAIRSGLAIKGDPGEFGHIIARLRYLETLQSRGPAPTVTYGPHTMSLPDGPISHDHRILQYCCRCGGEIGHDQAFTLVSGGEMYHEWCS